MLRTWKRSYANRSHLQKLRNSSMQWQFLGRSRCCVVGTKNIRSRASAEDCKTPLEGLYMADIYHGEYPYILVYFRVALYDCVIQR
jgi:hypothetical protein